LAGSLDSRRADRRRAARVVESLGAAFISSPYQNAYGFLLVLVVLLVRPHGLFGEKSREA